jgi:hypothetical protein
MSRIQCTYLRAWMDGLDKTRTPISMWFMFFESSYWNLETNGWPISDVLLLVRRIEFIADTSGQQLQQRKLVFVVDLFYLPLKKGRK